MQSPKEEEESNHTHDSPEIKLEKDAFANSSPANHTEDTPGQSSDDDDEVQIVEKGDDEINNNALVLYNPEANGAASDSVPTQSPMPRSSMTQRVLPSVGAFTVQCAHCFKWRLIPTKEKYEAIREKILQVPFLCTSARGWRPGISCEDEADITQDGSRLWAIDKPNIAQPPPGWDRILRIRGEGSTKFADVYYSAPNGKKLRSMVEINKFLAEHPEYAEGVTSAQFSFQIPKPLQENYVRKRPSRAETLNAAKFLEPAEVSPLSWAGPVTDPHLQIGQAETSTIYAEDDIPTFTSPPLAKKKRTKSPYKKATKTPLSSSHPSYNDDNITTPDTNSTYPEPNNGGGAADE